MIALALLLLAVAAGLIGAAVTAPVDAPAAGLGVLLGLPALIAGADLLVTGLRARRARRRRDRRPGYVTTPTDVARAFDVPPWLIDPATPRPRFARLRWRLRRVARR